jgi:hypothetical protein
MGQAMTMATSVPTPTITTGLSRTPLKMAAA